ncbi:MAG: hypothetical protein ACRYG7_01520 [Janthinobacterium lividum]
MQETTINQRLKFLIETLSVSVRAFSEAIGESTGNTNNYLGSRQLAPKHEYLSKVLTHFSNVNAHWLLTGNGEPFLTDSTAPLSQTNISGDRNNVASGQNGKAIQKNYGLSDCEKERDGLRAERDSLAKQVELLHGQLQTKDALIASKEETIDLLKAAFNRPN